MKPFTNLSDMLVCGIIAMLFCHSTAVEAQSVSSKDIIPKSPEAAAFDRIKDIPVNLYRGTLDFSIPLYTITDGDLSLPMSLDYQGSAIRVDQEATWVGLNWLLNVGGIITTRVSAETGETNGVVATSCGDPIAIHGDTICNSYIRDWKRALENPSNYIISYIDGNEFGIGYKSDGTYPNPSHHGANWFDGPTVMQPDHSTFRYSSNDLATSVYGDIFYYHNGEAPVYHAVFMGHNITFVWDNLKKEFFITGNKGNYKIEGNRIGTICITDEKGIKYYFGEVELTYPTGTDQPIHLVFEETLYLHRIESPTGHNIYLDYVDEAVYWPTRHISETVYDNIYSSYFNNTPANTDVYEQFIGTYTLQRRVSPYYEVNKKRLSSIRTNGLTVQFNALTNREDLNVNTNVFGTSSLSAVKLLDNIAIYVGKNGHQELLKKFNFAYSYFERSTVGGNMLEDMRRDEASSEATSNYYANDDFMYKRLKLDKMWESNKDGDSLPEFVFTYYTDHPLPCKNSAAQDYWGFYNGQENFNGNFHTLIPKAYSGTRDNMDSFYSNTLFSAYLGADRRSNIDFVYSGMLREVLYPTGARVSFLYEQNSFNNMQYETIKKSQINDGNMLFDRHKDETTLASESTISNFASPQLTIYDTNSQTYQSPYNKNSQFFLIEKADSILVNATFIKSGPNSNWHVFNNITACIFEYGLRKEPNGQYVDYIKSMVADLKPNNDDIANASNNIYKSIKIWLKPGRYELRTTGLANISTNKQFYQSNLSASATIHETNLYFGNGVRIASITYTNGDSVTTTKYKYGQDEFSTSGIISAPAVFSKGNRFLYSEYGDIIQGSIALVVNKDYKMATSYNLCPNTPTIGYSWIQEEKNSNNNTIGYRTYKFWNKRWDNSILSDYMVKIEDPRNGFLQEQCLYDTNDRLLNSTQYTYNLSKLESRWLNIVAENTYFGPKSFPYYFATDGNIMDIYIYPSVQFGINSTKKTMIQIEGNDTLTLDKWSYFDACSGLQTSVKKSTSIPGVYECENYFYPKDYTNIAWIDTLNKKHITSNPIHIATHTLTGDGDKLVSSTLFKYNSWGQLSEKYILNSNTAINYQNLVARQNNAFNTIGYENLQHIDYCGLTHNIRTVTDDSCLKTTYIWGYKNKYPVAMIQGTDSTSIGNLLNCSLSTYESREEIDHLDLYNRLKVIPGASVTTFSYAPFIGMTGCIKPNGLNFTYEYDGFLRLNRIKRNDETINNYYYYYKRQQ